MHADGVLDCWVCWDVVDKVHRSCLIDGVTSDRRFLRDADFSGMIDLPHPGCSCRLVVAPLR